MSTTPSPPPQSPSVPPTLTERMRSTTRDEHDKSDKTVNLKLALVLTSPLLYGEALSLFEPIYRRIERIVIDDERKRASAAATACPPLDKLATILTELQRAESFAEDMAYYLPSARRHELKHRELNELDSYLSHLDDLANDDPILIVAYVYHMYSAIFAGGYIIRKMVRKAMGLPKNKLDGVRAFSLVADEKKEGEEEERDRMTIKKLTTELKRIINEELELTSEEERRVIEEGKEVFRRNDALVGTVRGTEAWQAAVSECAKRIAWPMFLVVLVLWLSLHYQGSLLSDW